ncbi:sulfatase/phosphatase domain-containing protein, partial [Porphyromonas levii]
MVLRATFAFWDFLPTFAEIAGVKTPANIDGISMLPTLLGEEAMQKQHSYLYWEFYELGGCQAIRMGDWKLIRLNAKQPKESKLELYNL